MEEQIFWWIKIILAILFTLFVRNIVYDYHRYSKYLNDPHLPRQRKDYYRKQRRVSLRYMLLYPLLLVALFYVHP